MDSMKTRLEALGERVMERGHVWLMWAVLALGILALTAQGAMHKGRELERAKKIEHYEATCG